MLCKTYVPSEYIITIFLLTAVLVKIFYNYEVVKPPPQKKKIIKTSFVNIYSVSSARFKPIRSPWFGNLTQGSTTKPLEQI